jgi:hypothetical protein
MKTLSKVKIVDTVFRLCSRLRRNQFIAYNENNYRLFTSREKADVTIRLFPEKFVLGSEAKLTYRASVHHRDPLDSAIGYNYSAIQRFDEPTRSIYRYLARKWGTSNFNIVYYKNEDRFIDIYVDEEKLPICHPLDLVVKKRICDDFIKNNNGLIMHGSAVSLGKNGVVFSGDSGCGKTTLAKLFKRHNEIVINDDMLALKIKGRHVYAYSLPWIKNTEYIKNQRLVLGHILYPHFGSKEKLESVQLAVKLKILLRNIYLEPGNADYLLRSIDVLVALSHRLKQADFSFSKAGKTYQFLRKKLAKL